MQKSLLAAIVAAAALTAGTAALPVAAVAAAKPQFTISCVARVGGQTSVDWARAKLSQVTISWAAAGAVFNPRIVQVASPTPPHGFIVTSTASSAGVYPTSATATFRYVDGTTDEVTTPCTP